MADRSTLTRRELLRLLKAGALIAPLTWLPTCSSQKPSKQPQKSDDQILDEIQRAAFEFFWTEASPLTGLVKDRALADGNDKRTISSIAATGFGLTALCIGDSRA